MVMTFARSVDTDAVVSDLRTATFKRSPDTGEVVTLLKTVNDEIAYTEIAKRTGLRVSRVKALMGSVRRILLNEDRIVFGAIRGYGVKRLSDDDKVGNGQHDYKKVVRGARRAQKKLATIDKYELLSNEKQATLTILRTRLRLIHAQSKT